MRLEKYEEARLHWPKRGKHILAQYDEEGIWVYQAFNRDIARYAVEHQKFHGCPHYNPARMSWIKTNFLWMMYRCGWGTKDRNQTHTLALKLKRNFFDALLLAARTKGGGTDGIVRLQWDPDHTPTGDKHPGRRAVQLGLKAKWLAPIASGEALLQVLDMSEFVEQNRGAANFTLKSSKHQRRPPPDGEVRQKNRKKGKGKRRARAELEAMIGDDTAPPLSTLWVPAERIYYPDNDGFQRVAQVLGLDTFDGEFDGKKSPPSQAK